MIGVDNWSIELQKQEFRSLYLLLLKINKQLQDIQKNINDLSMQGIRRENPEFLMMINQLEQNQKKVLQLIG